MVQVTDWKRRTVETYNQSAAQLAEYFRSIGPRTGDIDKALELAGNPSEVHVLEIGCGDGRDAAEIIKRTPHYTGFDISKELIALAKKHVPDGNFTVADAVEYDYGAGQFDVVFAFASLLHLNKQELADVLQKIHAALKHGGILFVSLKRAEQYEERVKNDHFGSRIFYFYNPDEVKHLAGKRYKVVDEGGGFKTVGNTEWFELALQKQ